MLLLLTRHRLGVPQGDLLVCLLVYLGPTEATAESEARGTWHVTRRNIFVLLLVTNASTRQCLRNARLQFP